MTAIPARVAGVGTIACCAPPGPDGSVPATILAAAAIAGVDEVYRVGGAQAIAALAYGTESIRRVDVVVGPGSKWVSIAEREVRGTVGVPAAFAGPSEVVVVADGTAPVEWAAIDVIVQAEHGPDGFAWLVTWSAEVAAAVAEAVARLVAASPRRDETRAALESGGYAVLVDDPEHAMAVVNAIAPEHLELMVEDAGRLVALVRNAGAVFVGPYAPASFGDYLAGPSHVLPTFGTARLRVGARRRGLPASARTSSASPRRPRTASRPTSRRIADAEGLPAHAESARYAPAGRPGAPSEPGRFRRRGPGRMLEGAAWSGYHSPQVEVAVRLNTNEAPEPPPPEFVAGLAAAVGEVALNRYPDRRRDPASGARSPSSTGSTPDQVFCANGSNEVIQSLLLAYGGPGRSCRVVRADLRAAQPHRPAHLDRGSSRASGTRLPHRTRRGRPGARRRGRDGVRRRRAGRRLFVLPEQPDGARRAGRDRRGGARPRPGHRRRRRGVRPVRPPLGGRAPRRPRQPRRAADLLEDLVARRAPPRLRARRSRRSSRRCFPAALPYHVDAVKQAAGIDRPAVHRGDGRPGRASSPRGPVYSPDSRRSGSPRPRRSRTSSCSRPATATPTRSGRALVAALGPRPRPVGLAAARRAPAGDDRHRARRTTPSSPRSPTCRLTGRPERRRRRARLYRWHRSAPRRPAARHAERHRKTKESDILVELDLDGVGSRRGRDGPAVLRPHARASSARTPGFDLVVRATGDLDVDAHHTVEDTGIALGEALAAAFGDKAGIRRFASVAVPLDEALVEAALDVSGRPYLATRSSSRRTRRGSARRHSTRSSPRSSGGRSSLPRPLTLHVASPPRQEHPPRPRGVVQGASPGRSATRSASRAARVPSTKGVL